MSRTRHLMFFASTTLAATLGACKADVDPSLRDHGSCDVLLDCASVLDPTLYDQYESLFGPNGSCWEADDPQACRDACEVAIDGFSLLGESCGTCSSDADCSEFGAGSVCDGGYCIPGDGSDDNASGSGDGDGDPSGDGDGDVPLDSVSILLVIDNSASMGEEQANLGANFHAFLDTLDTVDVPWRIAITTTDNGNPWCAGTSPEGGKFVLSSCTNRLGDFLSGPDVDVQDLACNDICQYGAADLEVLPTTTAVDPSPKAHPWIEQRGGQTNLPASTSLADALACFLPQGVNGCGFESPLESALLGVQRANSPSEAGYGFIEDNSLLVVIIVSDEADCSYNKSWSEIFDVNGQKAFWSDPTSSFPTSAVCWNAGVECQGDPSGYDSCEPVDKAVNGSPTTNPDSAVLHPISRYVDGLQANAGKTLVFGIVGVGANGEVNYADSLTDPSYQDSFGIGPGCTAAGGVTAVPPVRMLSVFDEFGPSGVPTAYSICEPDYSPTLAAIADAIVAEL